MPLLTYSVAWTLLQQHPPTRKYSLFAGKGEVWELATGVMLRWELCHVVGVGSEGPGGSALRGMPQMAAAWEGWISQAAVGQGLALARQPGAAGDAEGQNLDGLVVQDPRAWLCPTHCALFLHALYFCMHQVHTGVEIKLSRREGTKKKKQVKPA